MDRHSGRRGARMLAVVVAGGALLGLTGCRGGAPAPHAARPEAPEARPADTCLTSRLPAATLVLVHGAGTQVDDLYAPGSTGGVFGMGDTGGLELPPPPPQATRAASRPVRPPRKPRKAHRPAPRRGDDGRPAGVLGLGGGGEEDLCEGGYTGIDGRAHCPGQPDYGADHEPWSGDGVPEAAPGSPGFLGRIRDRATQAWETTLERWAALEAARAAGCHEDPERGMSVCEEAAD